MQLTELQLINFRSFAKETVTFEKQLTILVGENNGGKSNLIDAVRLITSPLGGRRDLYCEITDIGTVNLTLKRSGYRHERCQAFIPRIPISTDDHQSRCMAVSPLQLEFPRCRRPSG